VEGMEKAMRKGSDPGGSSSAAADPFFELPEELTSLPSDEVVGTLVDVYFRLLQDSFFSFLHEGLFKSRMRENTLPKSLIYAVCAASARFV
jgi:hypothetical protein